MSQTKIKTAAKPIQKCNFEKGAEFEEYIRALFNRDFFHLKKWRQAKPFSSSALPSDYINPDLEIELVFKGKKNFRFAVECKWRERFYDGKIHWADDNKIVAYRKFQDQVRIPVFIAIGVGGSPGNPEKLFLTPLDNIYQYNELYETNLIPFRRKTTQKFFYDQKQLKLF